MSQPETLYHYCTPDAFLSIIQSRRLWLTHISYFEDQQEWQWFLNVVRERTAGADLSETPRSSKSREELAKDRKSKVESSVFVTEWQTETIEDTDTVLASVGNIKAMEVYDSMQGWQTFDEIQEWQANLRKRVARECRQKLIPLAHARWKEVEEELKEEYADKQVLTLEVAPPTYHDHDSKEHYWFDIEGEVPLKRVHHQFVYEHHMRAEIRYKIVYRH